MKEQAHHNFLRRSIARFLERMGCKRCAVSIINALTSAWRRFWRWLWSRLSAWWLRRRLRHRLGKGWPETASRQLEVVVLTVSPSRLLDRTLYALDQQTLPPVKRHIVRDVTPFSKATQTGLDLVKAPYYVSMDDDMILDQNCLETLFAYISRDEDVAEVVLQLDDPIQGRIYGVRIYRTEAVRKLGFYPLEDEKGAERSMTSRLQETGFRAYKIDRSAGLHHPDYTPEEAYRKFYFAAEKVLYYDDGRQRRYFAECLDMLSAYWRRTRRPDALAAMAGFIDGLHSGEFERELDASRWQDEERVARIEMIIGEMSAGSGPEADNEQ